MDIAVAAAALVVLAVPMAVIALAIVARMGRPALFRQQRSGLHGQEFTIYKFRTMTPPAYPDQPDPERTPPLGRMLRDLSVDELPQLWNVLRGDMSIIGPRPTLPEQVARYSAHQRRRLEVRPGLTGYAQVRGRNLLSWPERIELDIYYIDHRSLWLDLRIVLRTLQRLIRRAGVTAEGGVNPDFPG